MSEGHGDPPADVRSFLPRPGEPVEQYAERLRALHRDLTLVLEAVERGLAAAADPDALAPPVPSHEPVDVLPVVEGPPAEAEEEAHAAEPPRFRRARARVEVLPAASGASGRDDPADLRRRREDDVPVGEPEAAWAQAPPAPEAGEPETPRPPRFPRRPSDAAAERPAPDEPRWVEPQPDAPGTTFAVSNGEHLTAPTFPPPGAPAAPGPRLAVPPWLLAAFFTAWLVVVCLLVALLVS